MFREVSNILRPRPTIPRNGSTKVNYPVPTTKGSGHAKLKAWTASPLLP